MYINQAEVGWNEFNGFILTVMPFSLILIKDIITLATLNKSIFNFNLNHKLIE